MRKVVPQASELQATLDNFTNGAAVTPNDTTAVAFDALYVGGAGNVAVEMEGGASLTFSGVPVGTMLKIGVVKVLLTGTTATNIVGLNF